MVRLRSGYVLGSKSGKTDKKWPKDWPTLDSVRDNLLVIDDMETFIKYLEALVKKYRGTDDFYMIRRIVLFAAEGFLKFPVNPDEKVQKLLNTIIKKLNTVPHFKKYVKELKKRQI
jgi:hypothetical protein